VNAYPPARECPHRPPGAYAAWREEGPLVRVTFPDGRRPWLVTRHDDVRRLLRNPALSSDSTRAGYPGFGSAVEVPPLNRTMIGLDGPEHARLRRMLAAEFTVPAVNAMRPAVERICAEAAGRVAAAVDGEGVADLVEGFALPIASRIICQVPGSATSSTRSSSATRTA
jgi:cytochrome P450